MRFLLLLVGMTTLAALTNPVSVSRAVADDMDICKHWTGDRQINSCTSLINSGRLQGSRLAEAYNNRGLGHGSKSEKDRAIADFTKAIQLNPHYAEAFLNRGSAYEVQGFLASIGSQDHGKSYYVRAMADFEEAIRLDPNNPRAFAERGGLKSRLGDEEGAYADELHSVQLRNPDKLHPSTPPASIDFAVLTPDRERGLQLKDIFRECAECPEMVVVPAGSFTMGSPESELGRDGNESPQHTVTFANPFAVGRFVVTFDEWDACAKDHGCRTDLDDQRWGRGRRPVINVSWNDAKVYVAWLSKKTGQPYRLLSEAEYEYATRAGTQTAFPWGDRDLPGKANCRLCKTPWSPVETAPVGSFAANTFGLYDMVGNVWHWVEDCYHRNYHHSPDDGSAWTSPVGAACDLQRSIRGGSWKSLQPAQLRSAIRFSQGIDKREKDQGFRVARTLIKR